MAVICELSKSMINKIAAGEVIERPGNVVKELVENSVDAGALRIEIEIEKSGVERIKVTDNGCGIPSDQLQAALSPHSTSKISEPDDLFHISTLGFRGEALASIAEVTQLTLTSRASDAAEGAQIRCEGSERREIKPTGRAVGTTIEARNLFFNMPVRRKFLKSPQTEFSHIQEAVVRIAIPHTEIAFTLKRDGRVVLDLPVVDDMLERIRKIYGDTIADKLTRVESTRRNIAVSGYVGLPDLARGTAAMQYLFVNGRFFRDKALQHALTEAYRGLMMVGKHPVAFLNIATPPDFVDVNVHPTKQEVRFLDGQAMYAGLLSGVRDQFLRTDLRSRPTESELADAARLETQAEQADSDQNVQKNDEKNARAENVSETRETRFVPDVDPSDPIAALDSDVAEASRRDVLGWLRGEANVRHENRDDAHALAEKMIDDANAALEEAAYNEQEHNREETETNAAMNARKEAKTIRDKQLDDAKRALGGVPEFKKFPPLNNWENELETKENATRKKADKELIPAPKEETKTRPQRDELRERIRVNNAARNDVEVARDSQGRPVVQMCERYLVMETDDGVAIVDQHALHERILYEKLKANLEEGEVVAQPLLTPEVVDLTATEAAFTKENVSLFAKIGLTVGDFGGNTIMVSAYPAILGPKTSATEVFQAALAVFIAKKSKSNLADLLDAALKQAACKAAIKAGDALRIDETLELIALAEEEINSHHCPHGRPSTLVFTIAEIDKLFKRT